MSLELDSRQHALLRALGLGWVSQLDAPPPEQPEPRQQPAPASMPPAAVASPVLTSKTANPAGNAGFLATKIAAKPVGLPPAPTPIPAHANLSDLRQQAASCTACGLCQGRSRPVFAAGAERAAVLVVGESPSDADDEAGEVFMGQSGQLLDKLLASVGLGREHTEFERAAHLTHAVKCRPLPTQSVGDAELAACRGFLERQIEQVQPRVIVALGRLAVKQLLGSDQPLGKLRGNVHSLIQSSGQRIPVVVSYPPRYLLRNQADKAKSWQDLCLIADTAQLP